MESNINDILKMPTVIDKTHESCFKSYHVLNYVLSMVDRGDSKETIMEMAKFLTIGVPSKSESIPYGKYE